MTNDGTFHVLVVCTANHCRSPLLEFALRRRCRTLGLAWSVASAGTHALPGQVPHRQVRRLLQAHGDGLGDWVSRRLATELLDAADLVVVAESKNRNDVVRMSPRAASRTFLALPLAQYWGSRPRGLGASPDVTGLRQSIALTRQHLPATELDRDLPDPYKRGRRAFDILDQQVEAVVLALTRR